MIDERAYRYDKDNKPRTGGNAMNILKIYIMTAFYVFILSLTLSCVFTCNSKSPLREKENISITHTQVSGCGGFDNTSKRTDNTIPFIRDTSDYCNAEKLLWLYDTKESTLKALNSRILLNCCGEHDITAILEDGIITIKENDQPVDGTGRCRCECVFDFYIEMTGIPSGVVTVRLELTVDDTTVRKWDGTIDTRKEKGAIIIDDTPLTDNCP